MGKSSYLKQIESLRNCIKEHFKKIEMEKKKAIPDENLIMYWEKEIVNFRKEIIRAEKRLMRG